MEKSLDKYLYWGYNQNCKWKILENNIKMTSEELYSMKGSDGN